jgi:hypothetical protein
MTVHLARPVAVPSRRTRPVTLRASTLGSPSGLLISGGALALLGVALRPQFFGSPVDAYVQLAFSTPFVVADLAVFAGALLVTGSEVVLASFGRRPFAVAAVRAVLVLGCLLAAARVIVELVWVRSAALALAYTPPSNGVVDVPLSPTSEAFRLTSSADAIAGAFGHAATIVLWGIGPLLTVLTVRRIPRFPRLLTAAGLSTSALCLAAGALGFLGGTGPIARASDPVSTVLMVGCLIITGLWLATVGRSPGTVQSTPIGAVARDDWGSAGVKGDEGGQR